MIGMVSEAMMAIRSVNPVDSVCRVHVAFNLVLPVDAVCRVPRPGDHIDLVDAVCGVNVCFHSHHRQERVVVDLGSPDSEGLIMFGSCILSTKINRTEKRVRSWALPQRPN
jgi:hypothetical protein